MMFFSCTAHFLWMRSLVVLFMLVASQSWAVALPQFEVSDSIKSQGLSTLYWADTSKVATPAQAKAAMVSGELITAGFIIPPQDTHHWFAVTLVNPTDHTIHPSIYLKQAFPQIVNVHYEQQLNGQPKDKWVSLLSGTNIPLHQRLVWGVSPTFNLSLDAYQEQTYYLEIYSKIRLQRIDIKIGDVLHSSHFDLAHITLLKFFIGAVFLLSLITMLMYISVKETIYLYYCAYILCFIPMAIFDAALDLFFELPISDRSILYLIYNVLIIFFALFVGKALDAKQTLPWFNTMLKVSCVVSAVLAMLTLYDFNFFFYTLLFSLLLAVFVLGVAIYAAVIGNSSAQLLAFGIAVFVSCVVILRLTAFGLIPSNFFTDHAALFGSLIEMVLFSVVLFRRVITLNEDKNKASLLLLKLAHEAKAVLEKTVNERTLELKQATHLAEQANHAKGEFLATINHEMRTPLNGILGMVEMLQSKPSASEQTQHLSHLGAASRQLAGLINEVLDFSKIDQNLIVIRAEAFSSHSLVKDLTDLFSLSAEQKGIAFTIEVGGEVSDWLYGDMPHVKQILTNLIGNALKFTEQGEVRLSIGKRQLSDGQAESESKNKNHLITFEVTDTGCGMEQAQIKYIFSPYYQIEDQLQASELKSIKVGNFGTGLGLAISEGLTQAMGGFITVTSELGQGSCFSFNLVLPPSTAPHEDTHALLPAPQELDESQNCFIGINILLVEDSTINQNVITTFLQATGANISIFDTGALALAHFKDHSAHLILMDYRLPDTNGIEASKSIRAYEYDMGNQECPIVMHTADNRSSLSDKAQLAGIDQLLPKPFTQTQLINAIRQALGKHSSNVCAPLRPNINPTLIHLLDDFVDQNLISVQLCADHLIRNDFENLSEELHKCVGNAGLFGADELLLTVSEIREKMLTQPYDTDKIGLLIKQAERQLTGYRLWTKESG